MVAHTLFDADVLIVGAGPAGLTLGAAVADTGLQVTLLERQGTVALQDPPEGGREIALTRRARRVMTCLDLWNHLDAADIAPLNEARAVAGLVRHAQDHGGVVCKCFRQDNTLALLPLDDRICSAVVTLPAGRTTERLGPPDAAFAARIAAQSDGRLGALQAAGPRHHAPLVGVDAQRAVAPRCALIGDAAVGMHPATALGRNFGLDGVEVMACELVAVEQRGGGIGELAPLLACEREHRRTTLPFWLGTNAIVSLFTDSRRPAKPVRRAVLTVAERAPGPSRLLKAAIERQLTGGTLSAAAA